MKVLPNTSDHVGSIYVFLNRVSKTTGTADGPFATFATHGRPETTEYPQKKHKRNVGRLINISEYVLQFE